MRIDKTTQTNDCIELFITIGAERSMVGTISRKTERPAWPDDESCEYVINLHDLTEPHCRVTFIGRDWARCKNDADTWLRQALMWYRCGPRARDLSLAHDLSPRLELARECFLEAVKEHAQDWGGR